MMHNGGRNLTRWKPSAWEGLRGMVWVGVVATGLVISFGAAAQSIIKDPTDHLTYFFEAEPHGLIGLLTPSHGHVGLGPGFRGTFNIVDPGFVKTINNTIGIGVGFDWLMYHWDDCDEEKGDACKSKLDHYMLLPVVMQWNFYLHPQWSVFGESGIGFRLKAPGARVFDPVVFYGGGRWQFSEFASLTMRIGYPAVSVGVSFFL